MGILILRSTATAQGAEADWEFRAGISPANASVKMSTNFPTQASFDDYVNDTQRNNAWDTSVKCSGAGSGRFDIPSQSDDGDAGWWERNFSETPFATQYGQNQEFWVQWRQRFDPYMLTHDYLSSNTRWKQVIVGQGDTTSYLAASCTESEIVITQDRISGPASMLEGYHHCTVSNGFTSYWSTEGYYSDQNVRIPGAITCCTTDIDTTNVLKHFGNEWMTFLLHVKMGADGGPAVDPMWPNDTLRGRLDSWVSMWIGRENQPLQLAWRQNLILARGNHYTWPDGPYDSGWDETDADINAKYGKVTLTPFMQDKDATEVHTDASTWYDEVIVSENRIPDPGDIPPSYVRALGDYEGKELSTVKSGGYANPWAAFQANAVYSSWTSNEPFDGGSSTITAFQSIWAAWSGGCGDPHGHYLYVMGDGHSDGGNNAVIRCDLNSDDGTNPNGWSIVDVSAGGVITYSDPSYSDGRPTATHNYAGVQYDITNGRIYRFGGSPYTASGNPTSTSWYYDIDAGTWTSFSSPAFNWGSTFVHSFYDQNRDKILVLHTNNDKYSIFDIATGTYDSDDVTWTGTSILSGIDVNTCFDFTRKRGIMVGVGGSYLFDWDVWNDTLSCSTLSPTPPAGITTWRNPALVYDQFRDCFWGYAPRSSQTDATTLYRCDGKDLTWTTHTITTDTPTFTQSDIAGHYGRMVFLHNWDALLFSPDYNQPAFMIKLPQA